MIFDWQIGTLEEIQGHEVQLQCTQWLQVMQVEWIVLTEPVAI